MHIGTLQSFTPSDYKGITDSTPRSHNSHHKTTIFPTDPISGKPEIAYLDTSHLNQYTPDTISPFHNQLPSVFTHKDSSMMMIVYLKKHAQTMDSKIGRAYTEHLELIYSKENEKIKVDFLDTKGSTVRVGEKKFEGCCFEVGVYTNEGFSFGLVEYDYGQIEIGPRKETRLEGKKVIKITKDNIVYYGDIEDYKFINGLVQFPNGSSVYASHTSGEYDEAIKSFRHLFRSEPSPSALNPDFQPKNTTFFRNNTLCRGEFYLNGHIRRGEKTTIDPETGFRRVYEKGTFNKNGKLHGPTCIRDIYIIKEDTETISISLEGKFVDGELESGIKRTMDKGGQIKQQNQDPDSTTKIYSGVFNQETQELEYGTLWFPNSTTKSTEVKHGVFRHGVLVKGAYITSNDQFMEGIFDDNEILIEGLMIKGTMIEMGNRVDNMLHGENGTIYISDKPIFNQHLAAKLISNGIISIFDGQGLKKGVIDFEHRTAELTGKFVKGDLDEGVIHFFKGDIVGVAPLKNGELDFENCTTSTSRPFIQAPIRSDVIFKNENNMKLRTSPLWGFVEQSIKTIFSYSMYILTPLFAIYFIKLMSEKIAQNKIDNFQQILDKLFTGIKTTDGKTHEFKGHSILIHMPPSFRENASKKKVLMMVNNDLKRIVSHVIQQIKSNRETSHNEIIIDEFQTIPIFKSITTFKDLLKRKDTQKEKFLEEANTLLTYLNQLPSASADIERTKNELKSIKIQLDKQETLFEDTRLFLESDDETYNFDNLEKIDTFQKNITTLKATYQNIQTILEKAKKIHNDSPNITKQQDLNIFNSVASPLSTTTSMRVKSKQDQKNSEVIQSLNDLISIMDNCKEELESAFIHCDLTNDQKIIHRQTIQGIDAYKNFYTIYSNIQSLKQKLETSEKVNYKEIKTSIIRFKAQQRAISHLVETFKKWEKDELLRYSKLKSVKPSSGSSQVDTVSENSKKSLPKAESGRSASAIRQRAETPHRRSASNLRPRPICQELIELQRCLEKHNSGISSGSSSTNLLSTIKDLIHLHSALINFLNLASKKLSSLTTESQKAALIRNYLVHNFALDPRFLNQTETTSLENKLWALKEMTTSIGTCTSIEETVRHLQDVQTISRRQNVESPNDQLRHTNPLNGLRDILTLLNVVFTEAQEKDVWKLETTDPVIYTFAFALSQAVEVAREIQTYSLGEKILRFQELVESKEVRKGIRNPVMHSSEPNPSLCITLLQTRASQFSELLHAVQQELQVDIQSVFPALPGSAATSENKPSNELENLIQDLSKVGFVNIDPKNSKKKTTHKRVL